MNLSAAGCRRRSLRPTSGSSIRRSLRGCKSAGSDGVMARRLCARSLRRYGGGGDGGGGEGRSGADVDGPSARRGAPGGGRCGAGGAGGAVVTGVWWGRIGVLSFAGSVRVFLARLSATSATSAIRGLKIAAPLKLAASLPETVLSRVAWLLISEGGDDPKPTNGAGLQIRASVAVITRVTFSPREAGQ